MTTIVDELMGFLERTLEIDTSGLGPEDPLFSVGVIDSFSLVSILSYVEDNYNFKIGPLDVNLANFDTLERMSAYIERSKAV